MLNLNKTVEWLNKNAPAEVQKDVYNILKSFAGYAGNAIDTLNTLEDIEKTIYSHKEIKISIEEYKKRFTSLVKDLEEIGMQGIKVDNDILKMLTETEQNG